MHARNETNGKQSNPAFEEFIACSRACPNAFVVDWGRDESRMLRLRELMRNRILVIFNRLEHLFQLFVMTIFPCLNRAVAVFVGTELFQHGFVELFDFITRLIKLFTRELDALL